MGDSLSHLDDLLNLYIAFYMCVYVCTVCLILLCPLN